MSTSVDTAFITMFSSDVHVAYQRMGTKLRNTIRRKVQKLKGEKVTFQKYGTGEAAQKSRHGDVPLMNVDHSTVDCTMADWYAGEYVDDLDELKINIEERQLAAQAGACALGRKTDSLITTAMDATTNEVAVGTTGLTATKINSVFIDMGDADVPDDGQRYWPVAHTQWTELLAIDAFSNADYIGMEDLPYKGGMTAKRFMSYLFFTFSGLPKASTTRKTFAYHCSAMGHGIGMDVTQDITWQGIKQSHLVVNKMSQGSCLIDVAGIYEVSCKES